jgi:peroxiredoxin
MLHHLRNRFAGTKGVRNAALLILTAGLIAGTAALAGTGGAGNQCATRAAPSGNVQSKASLGQTAPDFALPDLSGKTVRLSAFKGRIVVLEWFNPECPFVNLAHGRSLSLKGKADAYKKKGVVWLAINSNGPGKQGYEKTLNEKGKKRFGMRYPVLLDPTGEVGRLYGAKRTPHLFVIDASGKLVYSGAVDNTQGGDPSDADPPPARNYVDGVLASLFQKQLPEIQKTEPWGCSVKYAN